MRTVLVTNIISLDGYYSDPDGSPLGLNMDPALTPTTLSGWARPGRSCLGRTSFEMCSSFWPMIADAPEDLTNPALNVVNREFSRQYGSIPKIVVSDSLEVRTDNPWRDTTEVVSRAGISSRLRAERTVDGGDIVIF